MLSSDDSNEISDKSEIVKEGYLDVKYPPGCPERKRWKVWHRRWVTVLNKKKEKHENMVYLQISDGCPPQVQQQQSTKTPTVLWKTEISKSAKFFRSHSGSRLQKTFGIAQVIKQDQRPQVLIYLAGSNEQQAELWMQALRNAILPPAPLTQVEDVKETRYSVSLIDDARSFDQGLLGTYGYLELMLDSVCVIHPHSGYIVAQWPLCSLQEGKLQRSDRGSPSSGVFTLTFRKTSKTRENEQLCFYSPEAKSAVMELNKMIKFSNKYNNNSRLSSNSIRSQKEIPVLEKINTMEPKHKQQRVDSFASRSDTMQKNSSPPISISRLPSEMHSNMLNSSISSTFQVSSNFDNSSDESDYSPPISPLRTDFCSEFDCAASISEGKPNTLCMPKQPDNAKQLNVSGMQSKSAHSVDKSHIYENDMRKASQFSVDLHVYSDIMTSRTWRQFSVGNETLYEELLDSPTNLQLGEEQPVPPLPPPRCPAKRPTDLRLEQLSESVDKALVNLEKISPSQSTPERKSAIYSILGNPLKGVKKILGKDKKDKSEQSSPVKSPTKESEQEMKRKSLEHFVSSCSNRSLKDEFPYEDSQYYVTAEDLPITFCQPEKPSSSLKSIVMSVASVPTTRKHSWSVDSLQPDDFKRKHTCLRHLLEHLESKSSNSDDASSYCSCPSSNQTNTPLASPYTLSRFARRQSKSLSADIEKHFRNLHAQAKQKPVKTGLTILNDINGKSQDPMYDYCSMGFAPASPEKTVIGGTAVSMCTNRSISEDSQNGYINMDMSKAGAKK